MKIEEFFDLYFSYVDTNTESAFVYHRWAILGAVATLIAKKVEIPLGHMTLYTNIYLQIIGKSGCRKSSAINIAVGLLKEAGYTHFAPKRCSKEAFLSKLARMNENLETDVPIAELTGEEIFDLADETASDILIAADEFNAFLGTTYDEFLEILSELYDMPDVYDKWLQKGTSAIRHPYVCILSGNTPSGFRLKFKGNSLNQGILTRFILIPWHETRQKIAFPQAPDTKLKADIVEVLKAIAKRKGTIRYSEGAYAMLSSIYEGWKIPTPVHMEQYVERRYTHLLRLCALFATIEGEELEVTEAIVVNANTMLASNERKMATAFMDIFDSPDQSLLRNIILDKLKNEESGMNQQEIYNFVKVQAPSYSNVVNALDTLVLQNLLLKAANGKYLMVKHRRDKSLDKYMNLEFLTQEERREYEGG